MIAETTEAKAVRVNKSGLTTLQRRREQTDQAPYEGSVLQTSSTFGETISYSEGELILSEVISALTFALDLTEDAVPGHSLRTCLLAMRLAEALGLPESDLNHLYYALLLKDIGCADPVTRLSQIMTADDRGPLSMGGRAGDLGADPVVLARVWREVLPNVPLPNRISRLLAKPGTVAGPQLAADDPGCTRGAETMLHLEMSEGTIEAVRCIDERWDGSGTPAGLRGEQIPKLARICAVAQTLDACATEYGAETALRVLRSRRGNWFDPEIVRAAQLLHTSGKLWPQCQAGDVEATRAEVLRLDPGVSSPLTPECVDRICEAFGNVVDAKSPFTFRHSIGVTEVAVSIARELGLSAERISLVRRAAFLHDIGKLAVPNRILDKRGRLDAREWAIVTQHPHVSGSILRRVAAFREIAVLAAEHHERLDGSGYPFGLTEDQLSIESRLIALADCYAAMAEDRPYRASLDVADILSELREDVPHRLDGTCFAALEACVARWGSSMPGLSDTPETIGPASVPAARRPPQSAYGPAMLSTAC